MKRDFKSWTANQPWRRFSSIPCRKYERFCCGICRQSNAISVTKSTAENLKK